MKYHICMFMVVDYGHMQVNTFFSVFYFDSLIFNLTF